MISADYLASAYDRNVQIIKMQTEGLSHEDSLIQLPFRGNCMNWIIGHVVSNRINVLKLLGAVEKISSESLERYIRDSDPITPDTQDAIPLAQLIELLEESQMEISNLLEEITDEVLQREEAFFGNRVMTVAEWLHFFFFHDSYHTGQTEILRQASGVDDKVI